MAAGPHRAKLAIVGIGNTMAGDDGAGIIAIHRLRRKRRPDPDLLLIEMEGDLFSAADLLERTERFIFVDAVIGEPPGRIVFPGTAGAAFAASLHQADIGTVMRSLEALAGVERFPDWAVWGITIRFPERILTTLSPAVDRGVDRLVGRLQEFAASVLGER